MCQTVNAPLDFESGEGLKQARYSRSSDVCRARTGKKIGDISPVEATLEPTADRRGGADSCSPLTWEGGH